MNKTEKKNVRISKALIFMIIGLLALALGFKMYNPQSSERAELFPEGSEVCFREVWRPVRRRDVMVNE